MAESPILQRMDRHIQKWQAGGDRRAIFLACYRIMTNNMLTALGNRAFADTAWVNRLLHHFADYYFHALEHFEANGPKTPAVWRFAFEAATKKEVAALQDLLLGVNAHINFDLVLTLHDLLHADWGRLTVDQRSQYYNDYCFVNTIISRTIDTVQDQVLEPAQPSMRLVDDLMGRVDEWLLGRMITHWRDEVWRHACLLLDTASSDAKTEIIQTVEHHALRRADAIAGKIWPLQLSVIV